MSPPRQNPASPAKHQHTNTPATQIAGGSGLGASLTSIHLTRLMWLCRSAAAAAGGAGRRRRRGANQRWRLWRRCATRGSVRMVLLLVLVLVLVVLVLLVLVLAG